MMMAKIPEREASVLTFAGNELTELRKIVDSNQSSLPPRAIFRIDGCDVNTDGYPFPSSHFYELAYGLHRSPGTVHA